MSEYLTLEIIPMGYYIFIAMIPIVLPLVVFQPKKVNPRIIIGIFLLWCLIGFAIEILAVLAAIACIIA